MDGPTRNSFIFPFLVPILACLGPDPDSQSGSGSADPIESGSNTDLDMKHWVQWSPQCFGSLFIWYGSCIFGWIRIHGKFYFFRSKKTTNDLFLGLHKRHPNYRRSLKPSKANINNSKQEIPKKNYTFVGHFCPPGSGSTDLIESGSEKLVTLPTNQNSPEFREDQLPNFK
jgi:hypothetical protein